VVQPALIGAADVHTGSLANGFEPFEDLNLVCPIGMGIHLYGLGCH
jgi:hypothetical protein